MKTPCWERARTCRLVATVAICIAASPSWALSPADEAEIRAQIEALRAEQAHIAEMQAATERKLRALEARLGKPEPSATAGVPAPASGGAVPAGATPVPSPAFAAAAPAFTPTLRWAGDLRVRGQGDYSDDDGKDRESMQVRARIGATYSPIEQVTLGARLVTGDPDDPNGADVQLSNWDDDFTVALDMAYAQFNFVESRLYGGKFPLPFARTDLVWDGDVVPQGLGGTWKHPLSNGAAVRSGALLFAIDESAAGDDSTMAGLQIGFDSAHHGAWQFDASAGYYDYSLGSLAGADAGDFRTNTRTPDGRYASDFDLLDILIGAGWQGENPRWPFRITGNYVKNLGAANDEDQGYGVDLTAGRFSEPGDYRFGYGYAQAEADAVLAAFSHDNLGIATNYQSHALSIDYLVLPKTQLSGVWYHYKPYDPFYAGANDPVDWLDRFRVYVQVVF